jgi:hypothetical protein
MRRSLCRLSPEIVAELKANKRPPGMPPEEADV